MQNAPDPDPRLIDAFWRVVAERGFHGVTFRLLSEASGESLEALRGALLNPLAILAAHGRAVDRAVLSGTASAPGDPVRDRIFDLLMRRFDVLAPHREGVLRLMSDARRGPLLALTLAPGLLASMAWMLEGAEVDTSGVAGKLRVQGLAAVWVQASRAWAEDDSADLGPTMSALDRALDRAERVARTIRLDPGDVSATPFSADPEAAPAVSGAGGSPPAPPPTVPPSPAPSSGGPSPVAGGPAVPLDKTAPLPPAGGPSPSGAGPGRPTTPFAGAAGADDGLLA